MSDNPIAAVLEALLKERDTLAAALTFYADPVSYENATPRHVRPVIADRGEQAREALQSIRSAEAS